MGSRPFPEIPCVICKKPVDLQVDLWLTKTGKPSTRTVTSSGLFQRI